MKGGVEVLMVSNKHNDGLIFPKGTYVSFYFRMGNWTDLACFVHNDNQQVVGRRTRPPRKPPRVSPWKKPA